MMHKTAFRTKFKNILNSINLKELNEKSKLITNQLLQSDLIREANVFFVYCSYGREVSTNDLINELLKLNKIVLIPKCDLNTETMTAAVYKPDLNFIKNSYGIKEVQNAEIFNKEIDVAIVPGVAFDKNGNRLGRGKGYYDKFLKNKNTCKIALCYSDILSEEDLPADDNDIKMDCIFTDRGVIKINS